MVEPLTGAVIVSLFFSEALKEGGKALAKGVADTFAKLVSIVFVGCKLEIKILVYKFSNFVAQV